MPDIFDYYKPFRNYLREADLLLTLGVIRAYTNHLQFDKPLPQDIQVAVEFLNAKDRIEKGVFEWDLEILVKEAIINSPSSESFIYPKDLRQWRTFSGAVNKVKDFTNNIAGLYPRDRVLRQLVRLAHQQFPWQSPQNGIRVGRYFQIFKHPELDRIMQNVFGLTTRELYTTGLALLGFYLDLFALDYPPQVTVKELSREKLDHFLRRFSLDPSTLKERMLQSQKFNEDYEYGFNPLRAYPLIRMKVRGRDSIVCPMPTLLIRRFTDGAYYEVYEEPNFDKYFGESFQNYAGEVLKRATTNGEFKIISEHEYHIGHDRKDGIDWILGQKDAALFIETKTKRLRLEAKIELTSLEVFREEIGKMADFVVQIYKFIRDYRAGQYPQYKFDTDKKIFPIVLTLENWFIFGADAEIELESGILKKFADEHLDQAWLKAMPYSIFAIEEFEKATQIMSSVGIMRFMDGKMSDPEKRKWPIASFMLSAFPSEYQKTTDLFAESFSEIHPEID